MKGQMKKQNGITLIALVITIIVLLILAGVSINMVLGQNGVLSKAQNAVSETKKASVLEEAQMIILDWQTENLVSKTSYEGRTAKTESGADVICTGGQVIVTNSAEGTIYVAPFADGVLGAFVEATNDTNSQVYKAMNPKVPTGYTHIAGEWNTGFVIKETETGDEFVWIPVVSEASYAKKSGSRNYHMSAQDVADHGKDVVSLYVSGDDYGTNSWITDATTEKNTVNSAGGFYVSRYEVGIASVTRESATQSGWTTATIKSQAGCEPARNITQTKSLELANTWKSVENQVQSGLITGTQWDVMCNFIGWSTCDSDCSDWGNYYNKASKELALGVGHSAMTTGSTYTDLDKWYLTSTTKNANTRMVFATGKFVNENGGTTDKKNIFDVAGNVWEWTTETISRDTSKRVLRGGSTNNNGNDLLATYRHGYNSASGSNWHVGFRAVLYVK